MNSFIKSVTVLTVSFFSLLGIAGTEYNAPIDNYNGGDPCIVETDSGCYYTFTTGGGIDIFKIEGFDKVDVIDKKTVFWAGQCGVQGDVWAPEIHKIGDRWYIIASALFDKNKVSAGTMPEAEGYQEHNDYYRYGFILESNTEDIFGEYTFKGMIAPDGLNNIDGTYLKKDGKLYYLCSAYVDVAHQQLFICEMENPYTLKAYENGKNNAVMLSKPQYLWEKRGWKVNEGPAVLYNGDDIYILYSASGYSSGGYCMGMLTYMDGDIADKSSWCKRLTPVSYNNPIKKIYNAGHCSFLYRDTDEIYMVYHATQTADFFESSRLTYIKPVEFAFGRPVI